MKKMLRHMGLGCLLALSAAAANANGYPNGSVKIVVPYPAASGTDAIARIVAEELGRKIKQPVIVENRPGAGGLIGTRYVTNHGSQWFDTADAHHSVACSAYFCAQSRGERA